MEMAGSEPGILITGQKVDSRQKAAQVLVVIIEPRTNIL